MANKKQTRRQAEGIRHNIPAGLPIFSGKDYSEGNQDSVQEDDFSSDSTPKEALDAWKEFMTKYSDELSFNCSSKQ